MKKLMRNFALLALFWGGILLFPTPSIAKQKTTPSETILFQTKPVVIPALKRMFEKENIRYQVMMPPQIPPMILLPDDIPLLCSIREDISNLQIGIRCYSQITVIPPLFNQFTQHLTKEHCEGFYTDTDNTISYTWHLPWFPGAVTTGQMLYIKYLTIKTCLKDVVLPEYDKLLESVNRILKEKKPKPDEKGSSKPEDKPTQPPNSDTSDSI